MNIFLALALMAAFITFVTNALEHPMYRPGLQPAVVAVIIGLASCFIWDILPIGR